MTIKRLFFAFEVIAPWPELPKGRVIAEDTRHMTVAFLGNIDFNILEPHLKEIPLPPFSLGFSGHCDHIELLPPKHPHVVSWHAVLPHIEVFESYAISLDNWLKALGLDTHLRLPWLPHITLARSPFNVKEWNKAFIPTPFYSYKLNLYESFPNLVYKPIWTHMLTEPIEEIEHTADIGFHIRGETLEALYHNAFIALAMKFPALLAYKQSPPQQRDELVPKLNLALSQADAAVGSPLKAVSYHGEVQENHIWEWEMIVDV